MLNDLLNGINEIVIFFLIIIFIALSYYDLKYSIILCIILFLIYIYFNKVINNNKNNDYTNDYKNYNQNVNDILNKLEKYKKYDEQSYKLGLKYYKYFINNIKLLYKLYDHTKFKSVLENSQVYLDTSLEKFNSILFSIDIYGNENAQNLTMIIKELTNISNKLIQDTQKHYIKIKDCDDEHKSKYNMFCDNDPQIDLFTNTKPEIYNIKGKEETLCRKTGLLYPIDTHENHLQPNVTQLDSSNIDFSTYERQLSPPRTRGEREIIKI